MAHSQNGFGLQLRPSPHAGGLSAKTQDANKSPKIAIWASSHNFVGLYLRN